MPGEIEQFSDFYQPSPTGDLNICPTRISMALELLKGLAYLGGCILVGALRKIIMARAYDPQRPAVGFL